MEREAPEEPEVPRGTPVHIRPVPELRAEPAICKVQMPIPVGHPPPTVFSTEEPVLCKTEPIREIPHYGEATEALAEVEPVPTEVEAEAGSQAEVPDITRVVTKAEEAEVLTTPEPIRTTPPDSTKGMAWLSSVFPRAMFSPAPEPPEDMAPPSLKSTQITPVRTLRERLPSTPKVFRNGPCPQVALTKLKLGGQKGVINLIILAEMAQSFLVISHFPTELSYQ